MFEHWWLVLSGFRILACKNIHMAKTSVNEHVCAVARWYTFQCLFWCIHCATCCDFAQKSPQSPKKPKFVLPWNEFVWLVRGYTVITSWYTMQTSHGRATKLSDTVYVTTHFLIWRRNRKLMNIRRVKTNVRTFVHASVLTRSFRIAPRLISVKVRKKRFRICSRLNELRPALTTVCPYSGICYSWRLCNDVHNMQFPKLKYSREVGFSIFESACACVPNCEPIASSCKLNALKQTF